MSTTATCGMSGYLSMGGEIVDWNLKFIRQTPEVTNMNGGGWKEFIPCLRQATGDFTSNIPCGLVGLNLSADFVNGKHTYTCDIIITSCAKSVIVNDKVGYKYTWTSTGEVTES